MHVAIIMDGNGRWAARRGLRRSAGHQAGAKAVRRIVEAATRGPVDVLTLYAFSSDNWSRPPHEVATLMRLLKRYLQSEVARCVENGVRLNVIGRRDRLSPDLVRIIERSESVTAHCDKLILQIAVDYSSRDSIVRAAGACGGAARDRERFAAAVAAAMHSKAGASCVDLLIRTGGERRLSDFLLWECAYAELVFVDEYWPDFDERAFEAALAEFYRRERRFGGLPGPASKRAGDAR
ncbi:MAG TPA: polyprenyl diphosphate synthase [Gammaproteobacteria bacterium]|nr:polyprenyl diphosphate synthase [Gammaproteobacteria bacterium]